MAEQLTTKLRARMETLRVGSPLDKSVDIGAIVAPVQLERIAELVQQGCDEGATCWQPSWSVPTEGLFYPPTLFTNVSPAATVAQVEIFGPVVVLMTFRTPDEAVEIANNTRYGLAASVWSENINLALDVAPRLKAGTVWINCTNMFDAASGFGGYRESGYGREGGREGMYEYLKVASRESRVVRDSPSKQTDAKSADRRSMPPSGLATRDSRFLLSTARPSSTSAASRRGPIPDMRSTCTTPREASIARGRARQSQGHPQRGRGGARGGGWARATAHLRAQVLYYIGENLAARSDEFAARLRVARARSNAGT